jgi:hypothetical protein
MRDAEALLNDPASLSLAGVCTLGAIGISIFQVGVLGKTRAQGRLKAVVQCVDVLNGIMQILCHLRNYTEPVFQVRMRIACAPAKRSLARRPSQGIKQHCMAGSTHSPPI